MTGAAKIGSGETANPIWQLLRNATLYDFVQRVAGTERVRRELVRDFMLPKRGDRVLDLGCGTGDLLACLSNVDYVGIDLNDEYVATARRRYNGLGKFIAGDATRFEEQATGPFEIVVAVGLLHHLDDEGASRLARAALTVLERAGRFVSVDPCFDSTQGKLQRWMVSRDRGRAVRTPDGYRRLFPSGTNIECSVRHNWGNIPWSHCVLVVTTS